MQGNSELFVKFTDRNLSYNNYPLGDLLRKLCRFLSQVFDKFRVGLNLPMCTFSLVVQWKEEIWIASMRVSKKRRKIHHLTAIVGLTVHQRWEGGDHFFRALSFILPEPSGFRSVLT